MKSCFQGLFMLVLAYQQSICFESPRCLDIDPSSIESFSDKEGFWDQYFNYHAPPSLDRSGPTYFDSSAVFFSTAFTEPESHPVPINQFPNSPAPGPVHQLDQDVPLRAPSPDKLTEMSSAKKRRKLSLTQHAHTPLLHSFPTTTTSMIHPAGSMHLLPTTSTLMITRPFQTLNLRTVEQTSWNVNPIEYHHHDYDHHNVASINLEHEFHETSRVSSSGLNTHNSIEHTKINEKTGRNHSNINQLGRRPWLLQDKPFDFLQFEYKWVNFEPSTLDGQLMMEAVNQLKLQDGNKVFNFALFQENRQDRDDMNTTKLPKKFFCLDISTEGGESRFFDVFYIMNQYHCHASRFRFPTLLSVWEKVMNSGPNQHPESKFWAYKTHVLADFEQPIMKFQNKIYQIFSNESQKDETRPARGKRAEKIFGKKVHAFNKAMDTFTIYLLFVDAISAIMPVKDLDNEGELLRSQREIAGKFFFTQIADALFGLDDLKDSESESYELIQLSENGLLRQKNVGVKVIETALYNWIKSSRIDLADLEKDRLPGKFRIFFQYFVCTSILSFFSS